MASDPVEEAVDTYTVTTGLPDGTPMITVPLEDLRVVLRALTEARREARVLEKLVQDLESASESQHEDGTPEGYLPGEVLHMIDEICQEVEREG